MFFLFFLCFLPFADHFPVLQILPIVWEHGLFYAICHNDAWTPRMETYYIINYFVRFLLPNIASSPC